MPSQKGGGREYTILVVDDSASDRRLAGAIIDRIPGWKAVYADNGRTALAAMEREDPHLVLTDLLMPEMDGLELVAAVRDKHPLVPVVLMTVHGNEEIAIRSLRSGAASYVPKRILEHDLAPIVFQVLTAAQVERRQGRLLEFLKQAEMHFTLDNDRSLIPALIAHLQQYLVRLKLCDHTGRVRVRVALEEALVNAIYHGNLEVSSVLREGGEEAYYRLADERRRQSPYQERRIYCTARFSTAEAVYIIRDEGPGFDPSSLPDPTNPANMEKASGRGLLLIRTFMDEVAFNDPGNQITLIKRRESA
jgi:CheY-like chemotaxis protein